MKIYNLLKIRSEMTDDCIYILSENKRDIEYAGDMFTTLIQVERVLVDGNEMTGIEFYFKEMNKNKNIIMLDDYDNNIILCTTDDKECWVLCDENRHIAYIINEVMFISERF